MHRSLLSVFLHFNLVSVDFNYNTYVTLDHKTSHKGQFFKIEDLLNSIFISFFKIEFKIYT